MAVPGRPVVGYFLPSRGLHRGDAAVTRDALGAGHEFHRSRTVMFLVTGGTTILDRIRFVESMGTPAQFGVARLATDVDLFDATGRSALAETCPDNLTKLSERKAITGNQRFVVAGVTIGGRSSSRGRPGGSVQDRPGYILMVARDWPGVEELFRSVF